MTNEKFDGIAYSIDSMRELIDAILNQGSRWKLKR